VSENRTVGEDSTMRSRVKSAERQGVLVLHRARELLVRQRTMLINAIRAHCAEFGIIAPQDARRASELVDQIRQTEVAPVLRTARRVG
jgi:transposase